MLAVVVGIVTALLIAAVRRAAERVDAQQRVRMPALLLGGGLAVGLLAQLTESLGGNWDETLFSGQSAVPELVAEGSLGIVLLVLTTKAIAYAICLGCGFRGGPVFPAIFLGVGVATIPVIVFDMSPTVAVAIGTAAGMAAGHAAAVRVGAVRRTARRQCRPGRDPRRRARGGRRVADGRGHR